MFGYMLENARNCRDSLEKKMKEIDRTFLEIDEQIATVDSQIEIAKIEEEMERQSRGAKHFLCYGVATLGVSFIGIEFFLSSFLKVPFGSLLSQLPVTLGVGVVSIVVSTPLFSNLSSLWRNFSHNRDFLESLPEEEENPFLLMLQEKSLKQLRSIRETLLEEEEDLKKEKASCEERYGACLENLYQLQGWEEQRVVDVLADSREEWTQFQENPELLYQKIEYLLFQEKLNAYLLEHPEFRQENFFETTFRNGEIVPIYPKYREWIEMVFGPSIFQNSYFQRHHAALLIGEEEKEVVSPKVKLKES